MAAGTSNGEHSTFRSCCLSPRISLDNAPKEINSIAIQIGK